MTKANEPLESVAAAARRVETETGVAARVLLAVALVESAAVAFAAFDGRREPLIRFEGHYFDRLLPEPKRALARKAALSNPKAGAVGNPRSQAARWRLLDRAAAIDAGAAYASTSWGLGQVMGAHWKRLGYADPQALAAEVRGSADGQLRIVARFLTLGGLVGLLEAGAFEDFARAYNGPAFRKNGYDAKIEAAFAKAGRLLADLPAAASGVPRPPVAAPARLAATNEAAGWSRMAAGLSKLLSWPRLLRSTSAPTRFSSTSTARSPSSGTPPPPSGSIRPNSAS